MSIVIWMTIYTYKKINAKDPEIADLITIRARIEEPGQDHFQVVGKVIPVEDKIILNQKRDGANKQAHNDAGVEPASVRFQNNMRWLAGLRDCVKWVQDSEYEDHSGDPGADAFPSGPWEW